MERLKIEDKLSFIREVCAEACSIQKIETENIYKRKGKKEVYMLRSMVFHLLHKKLLIPASIIAFEFRRDIRTVRRDCAVIDAQINIYDDYKKKYEKICSELKNRLNLRYVS